MASSSFIYTKRRIKNIVALTLSVLATLIGLIFLAWILWKRCARA